MYFSSTYMHARVLSSIKDTSRIKRDALLLPTCRLSYYTLFLCYLPSTFERTDRLFLCYSSFSVLTAEERQQLFPPVLPAFVRFCKAFPPLMEDVVGLLLQYGRICASEDSLQPLTINGGLSPDLVNGLNSSMAAATAASCADPKERHRLESLPQQVQDTFAAILDNSVLEKRLY